VHNTPLTPIESTTYDVIRLSPPVSPWELLSRSESTSGGVLQYHSTAMTPTPESLWRASTTLPTSPALERDLDIDVAIIGGGVTGLTAAVLLSRTRPGRKGLLQCRACRKQFSVTVGTVFEDSHIKLTKWIQAIYLIGASKKGSPRTSCTACSASRTARRGSWRIACATRWRAEA
jgi:hypothetical protein